jgi:hypothetical protein
MNLKGVLKDQIAKDYNSGKKFKEGRQKWKDPCIIAKLSFQMLKIPMKIQFASQVILFKKTFEYHDVILIYYRW